MLRRLLILILLFFLTKGSPLYATHLVGADITYKQIDSLKFQFDLYFYRDCRGIPFANPSSETKLRCGSNLFNVTLTLVKIEKLKTGNDSFCNPLNSYGTGGGFEKHHYTSIINFGDSYYKSAYNCSSKIILETGQCCRSSGAGGQYFYNYAELNLKAGSGKNSSPVFLNDPVVNLCCNEPTFLTFNARDTVDSDSLSYHFDYPKLALNTNYTYSSSYYSYNKPYQVYYSGTNKFPYSNPDATIPEGIYLDSRTGDVIITPVKCDEVTVVLVEVREWRRNKDSSNRYVQVGAIRRDIIQIVQTCSTKNPIIQPTSRTYFICEDSTLCVDLTADDNKSDTIKIGVQTNAPGATISKLSKGGIDTIRFCYTLRKAHIEDLPFEVSVVARNNAKQLNNISTKTISIYSNLVESKSTIERKLCNLFEVRSDYDSIITHPLVQWKVYDDQMKEVNDSATAYFNKAAGTTSNLAKDELQFRKNGKYYVEQVFRPSFGACARSYWDSLWIVNADLKVIPNIKDTSICTGDTLRLFEQTHSANSLNFHWSVPGDSLTLSTDSILLWGLPFYNQSKKLKLRISDSNGCSDSAWISITTFPDHRITFDNLYQTCEDDTIEIPTPKGYHSYLWSNGIIGSPGKLWSKSVLSVYYEDSTNCDYTDTLNTYIFDKPVLNMPDLQSCDSALLSAGNYPTVIWQDTIHKLTNSVKESGIYHIYVQDYFNCEARDTFEVTIKPSPNIHLGKDTAICGDSIKFNLRSDLTLKWNNGANSSTIKISFSGNYNVMVTDSMGCVDQDTVFITKWSTPLSPLIIKRADSLISNRNGFHYWYRNDSLIQSGLSNFFVMTIAGEYTARYMDSNQCESAISNKITYITGSIQSKYVDGFKLYPNPGNGTLMISTGTLKLGEIKNVQLTDLQGRNIDCKQEFSDDLIRLNWTPSPGIVIVQLQLRTGELIYKRILVN